MANALLITNAEQLTRIRSGGSGSGKLQGAQKKGAIPVFESKWKRGFPSFY